jgi:hypothetical protein
MLESTKQLFESHKHIYTRFVNHGLLIDFHQHIQDKLLLAYNEETGNDYDYDEKCYECVAEFIHLIYTWYNGTP